MSGGPISRHEETHLLHCHYFKKLEAILLYPQHLFTNKVFTQAGIPKVDFLGG